MGGGLIPHCPRRVLPGVMESRVGPQTVVLHVRGVLPVEAPADEAGRGVTVREAVPGLGAVPVLLAPPDRRLRPGLLQLRHRVAPAVHGAREVALRGTVAVVRVVEPAALVAERRAELLTRLPRRAEGVRVRAESVLFLLPHPRANIARPAHLRVVGGDLVDELGAPTR